MKAIQIDGYGGADNLVERELPTPVPESGQVLVRVHATTLNPIELKLASGDMRDIMPVNFPWTPGADFSGVVESLGDGVLGLQIGDEVYGFASSGGAYAEQLIINADQTGPKPQSISHVEAASLGLVAQTALQALDAALLTAGQTILIQGASGAVGGVAVQLAHIRGARVIASGSLASGSLLTQYGADQVVDYKTTPFESVATDVDAVLDTVGGDTQNRSFSVIKKNGILVALTQPPPQELADQFHVRTVMLDTHSSSASLATITTLVDAGKLKPNVGKVYPISDVASAWREWPNPSIFGKVVFTIPS